MLLDHALQCDQAAVEKMACPGKHDNRKRLGPRPVEHIFQKHDVIFLAVDDKRIRRHIADRKASDRGCGQYEMPRRKALRHSRRDKTSEGKSADRKFALAVSPPPVLRQREEILDFAAPFVEYTITCPDTAEIRPQRAVTECDKCLRHGLHDFVVQRTAV